MPNTEWKDYLIPINYPPGIRPTLRDAVSYLFTEMLADTNGWKPDQLNEIYRLNLKKLAGNTISEVSLVDPAQHPLEKICFILADLENWHTQKEHREAALEARLERYRYLHQHFSHAEDRKFIESELENYLKPLSDVTWWSEGMAQLAEFMGFWNESDFNEPDFDESDFIEPGFNESDFIEPGYEAPDYPMYSRPTANQGNEPDALIRARQVARHGEAAHP